MTMTSALDLDLSLSCSGAVSPAAVRRIHGEDSDLLPGYRQDADEGKPRFVVHSSQVR